MTRGARTGAYPSRFHFFSPLFFLTVHGSERVDPPDDVRKMVSSNAGADTRRAEALGVAACVKSSRRCVEDFPENGEEEEQRVVIAGWGRGMLGTE